MISEDERNYEPEDIGNSDYRKAFNTLEQMEEDIDGTLDEEYGESDYTLSAADELLENSETL